ncbi:MAG: CRISPR-associated protein Csx3 [Candidatus Pacebacteria bacterium]|nr:CRISPR-associated protein Csx3 [Candidatus Paceibacterota bacterium]
MATYNIEKNGDILKVAFGDQADNDQIVQDAQMRLDEMIGSGELSGGQLIKINGPASLPVAMVIAHALGHMYGAVAAFDPKLGKYVVATAHGGIYQVGDLVD